MKRMPVSHPQAPTRKLSIIAQDPAVRSEGGILTTQVDIPAEKLDSGPRGYRVQVIDYDGSTNTLYKPLATGLDNDPFQGAPDSRLLSDRHLHAQIIFVRISL